MSRKPDDLDLIRHNIKFSEALVTALKAVDSQRWSLIALLDHLAEDLGVEEMRPDPALNAQEQIMWKLIRWHREGRIKLDGFITVSHIRL